MYTNLYRNNNDERRFGEGLILVNVREFQTIAMHMSDDVRESNGKRFHVLIFPAQFNPLRYINDPLELEAD